MSTAERHDDPADRESETPTVPLHRPDAVDDAVARAREAARVWQTVGVAERAQVLLRYRDQLIDHLEEIIAVVQSETNKPRFDVINEVFQVCNLIGCLARRAPRWLASRRVGSFPLIHKRAEIHYRPLGVVGVISPSNYPVTLALSPVLQALVAGNAVVLKPSEHTTETARLLHQLFEFVPTPSPVFQIVVGGPGKAVALAEAEIDKICFAGGTQGGRVIAQAAARKLMPVLLELGGNDAMLVARDADVERAARAAVWGAFLNAGQSCIAVERCYVDEQVADRFLELVVQHTAELSQGLANDPNATVDVSVDHDVGPLLTAGQYHRVAELVADAVERGATVLVGGLPEKHANLCFPPTVLSDVDHNMRLMNEETFGPVLPVMRVAHMDEAVELANDSRYGLSASIWSADVYRARWMASRLRVGGVVINDCLLHFAVAELPFGGRGESGIGRTHGREGLHEFCTTQTITQHRFGPRREFHWFPYGEKHRLMTRAIRLLFRSGFLERFRRSRHSRD